MTNACSRPRGDERKSRQAVGGGDCIICVKERPDGPALEVLQVVEGMSHRREAKRVEIPILMVVRNPHKEAAAMWVVHRAEVTASLKRFRLPDENSSGVEGWEERDSHKKPLMDMVRSLYAGRLCDNPGEPGTALFWCRENCLGVAQTATKLSLKGPSGCFDKTDEIPLDPKFQQGERPSYCSFLLPSVAAGQTDIFVLWLTLEGESYQRLIGDRGVFTVDSYTRLLRQIEAFDLEDATDEGNEFHRQHMEPDGAIIAPAAYDIVIFQGELGTPISVETGSICILQVQPEDKLLAEQVLWFYSQPEEFYLVLRYESATAPKPAANGFVVRNRAGAPSCAASH